VCLPSYREGLPTTLLEAGACGLPLVATDVPGCREVVIEGDNGLLVPAGDADTLAEALRALIADPGRREVMGRRSRGRVLDNFTASIVAEATVEVYRERLAMVRSSRRCASGITADRCPEEVGVGRAAW
jgi:glycosyltransferase involved in cell wall biosynthesis